MDREWKFGDSYFGPHVPKEVRRGGATGPSHKVVHRSNLTSYRGHSTLYECVECGTVEGFVTSEFMTDYYCDECGDVRSFEFQWELNR